MVKIGEYWIGIEYLGRALIGSFTLSTHCIFGTFTPKENLFCNYNIPFELI